jgi:hypothetical protein
MDKYRGGVDSMATQEGKIGGVMEKELAEQVEAMRDDVDAWGDPVPRPKRPRKSERRHRGAMVSVRFSPEELAAVQAHASDAGASVSGYLRNLALATASRPIVTVAWLGWTAANSPTTEERLLVRSEQACVGCLWPWLGLV